MTPFIIILILLAAGGVLAVIKLITFKKATGKAVVLDVLTTLVTAVLVILSVVFDSGFLLDIALIYAILSFAAVLAAARYLEKGM